LPRQSLDVRPEDEFRLGHLPGARNIPLSRLKRQLSRLDRNSEIVAYCRGPYFVLAFEAVALFARARIQGAAARGWLSRVEGGWLTVRNFASLMHAPA